MTPVLKDKSYPDHPGLLHTYIHMTERDLTNPLGLIVARKIPAFSNGVIAHYTHMPNHIFWRRGMYKEAIRANLAAIAIDINYFKQDGAGLNSYYYEYHFLHSHHFLTILGVLTNNEALAIDYARAIKRLMDVNRMADLPDYRDTFFSLEHLVLARFNRWQDVLSVKTPLQTEALGLLLIDFSQALAYLHLGKDAQFKSLYDQIKNKTYTRQKMIELQTLVVSYLKASNMSMQNAPLADIEQVFINNKVDKIEEKLFVMNPPLWFFPYQLLLSDVAAKRSDWVAAKKHHLLYEKIYPKSTLGNDKP